METNHNDDKQNILAELEHLRDEIAKGWDGPASDRSVKDVIASKSSLNKKDADRLDDQTWKLREK